MSAVIERCRLAGIRLRVEGDTLRYDAPKGAMTPDLVASLKAHKREVLAALSHPDPLPPLSPEAEARRQKVLAMLARDGGQYAALVEDPSTDPVVLALATPAGTCDVLLPKDRYDPFAVLELMKEWEGEDAEPEPSGGASQGLPTACHPWHPGLSWRVAIQEPNGRTIEVDTPSGWILAAWQAYAERYHGPACTVPPIAGLPKPLGHRSTSMRPWRPPVRGWRA